MLPFDNRPWARTAARAVIVLSILAAAFSAYYLYDTDDLHISEVAIIGLSLLLVLPPNIAIVMRGRTGRNSNSPMNQPRYGAR